MARVLIVGGEERGRVLAAVLLERGYAVRVVGGPSARARARTPPGAEPFDADPERPGTLKAALEQVTIACWLFGSAAGTAERLRALHGARLERFLHQTIDSSMRGLLYEAAGSIDPSTLAAGRRLVSDFAMSNAVPLALITAEPSDPAGWLAHALDGVVGLVERYPLNPMKPDRVSF
jgi:hypothetical protein